MIVRGKDRNKFSIMVFIRREYRINGFILIYVYRKTWNVKIYYHEKYFTCNEQFAFSSNQNNIKKQSSQNRQ